RSVLMCVRRRCGGAITITTATEVSAMSDTTIHTPRRFLGIALAALALLVAGCGGGSSSSSSSSSSAASPPPASSSSSASTPSSSGASGIPQGPNAGDRDSDNNGGPSDGDGNL